MKKVKYRHSVSRVVGLSLAVLLAFSVSLFAQEGDPVKGKSLFNTNCAACHKLDKPSTGPGLWQVWRISMSVGGCKVG